MPIALLDIGFTGKLVAGGILGLGLLWYIVGALKAARKTEIEKIAVENVIKQEQQNEIIVEQVKKDVEVAKSKVADAAPTDW